MKLITENEIILVNGDRVMDEQFSAVTAETQEKLTAAKEKAKKVGYFSKERKEGRQEDRAIKKIERIEANTAKIEDRIAKKGARPLQATVVGGVKKFKDRLPTVKKQADGTHRKPTGEVVDPKNLATVGGVIIDKTDAANKPVVTEIVNGIATAVTNHNENETLPVKTETGAIEVYKASDVEVKPEGWSTTTKVLIGVGVLAGLGLIIYLVKRGK